MCVGLQWGGRCPGGGEPRGGGLHVGPRGPRGLHGHDCLGQQPCPGGLLGWAVGGRARGGDKTRGGGRGAGGQGGCRCDGGGVAMRGHDMLPESESESREGVSSRGRSCPATLQIRSPCRVTRLAFAKSTLHCAAQYLTPFPSTFLNAFHISRHRCSRAAKSAVSSSSNRSRSISRRSSIIGSSRSLHSLRFSPLSSPLHRHTIWALPNVPHLSNPSTPHLFLINSFIIIIVASSAQALSPDGVWGDGGMGDGGSIATYCLLRLTLARAPAQPCNPARCFFLRVGRSSHGRRHFLLPFHGPTGAQRIDKYSSMAPRTPWPARWGRWTHRRRPAVVPGPVAWLYGEGVGIDFKKVGSMGVAFRPALHVMQWWAVQHK